MKKRKRLVEEYAYPGFRPLLTVEKHPLDDGVRVISLRRRQKKTFLAVVEKNITPSMIER